MAEQQQLCLFHAEAVASLTAGKALWQELEYYSLLPVFWCFLSTGPLKTFIQIYHCLVIKGILCKVATNGHLVKGSLQQLPQQVSLTLLERLSFLAPSLLLSRGDDLSCLTSTAE